MKKEWNAPALSVHGTVEQLTTQLQVKVLGSSDGNIFNGNVIKNQ